MAATTQIISFHGAAAGTETQIDGASIKYKRADNDTNDNLNPTPLPGAGTVYSWRKAMKLKVTATPDAEIDNLRWFSDGGSWGTGITLMAKLNAVYTQGSAADETAALAGTTDASTYTSAAPLTVNAGQVIANPSTGYGTQSYVESQLNVASTASRGVKGPRTFTYRYDEI